MKVTYKPEGAEPKVWLGVKRGRIMSPEAEAIERHTGMHFGQWWDALTEDSMLAMHGLLFVLLKRNIPTLKWEEVQFYLDEVEFEFETDEKAQQRDILLARQAAGETLDDAAQSYLDGLKADLAESDDEVAEDPKADES